MTITALSVITDAMERCNKLAPGETLDADVQAFAFRRLNLLVDEMGADAQFLYKSLQTSVSQTGNITLGTGSWAAITPGDTIISAAANGLPMAPISMQQYNELYAPTTTGTPNVWAHDGMSTVYLYPVPATAVTISLLTGVTVTVFADLTTAYTVPEGYESALGAGLAVRIAPTLLGTLPPALIRAESQCMGRVSKYKPAILNVSSYTRPTYAPGRILNGW